MRGWRVRVRRLRYSRPSSASVFIAFFLSGKAVDFWYRSSRNIPQQEDLSNDSRLGMFLLGPALLSLMVVGPICFFAGSRWVRRRLARSS